MSAPHCVSTVDISKNYGKLTALDTVSLAIEPGACVALVGPNGAGKSTLFKLILGLITATSGSLQVLGRAPADRDFDKTKKQIGFLPEQVLFHGALTGRETLQFYTRLKQADLGAIDPLFERVGLSAAADRRVSTYSKGMRQRLGLAQALIGDPQLLLLDEPTTGLDPDARQNLFQIVDQEKQKGAAILLSSHILTELEARTDRIAILNSGRLIADASLDTLVRRLALPSRIVVRAEPTQMQRLAEKYANRLEAGQAINGTAVLDCRPDEKLGLLKELMAGDLKFNGLDIREPSLEQVFAAYTTQEKAR